MCGELLNSNLLRALERISGASTKQLNQDQTLLIKANPKRCCLFTEPRSAEQDYWQLELFSSIPKDFSNPTKVHRYDDWNWVVDVINTF